MMEVSLRPFEDIDIQQKVFWINDDRNNQFLHYDLPLTIEKTEAWFSNIQSKTDRYDAVIEFRGVPVGITGLLSISGGRAEYYVLIGEQQYKHLGIAKKATELVLYDAFTRRCLKEIYLYTEVNNISAQRLFERCGFSQKGIVAESALNRGRYVDRYYYVISRDEFFLSHDVKE